MSEPENATELSPSTWPPLNTLDRRVLGVLIEKQKTTPDAYPLSINSIVTGSNQKSNREPLLNIDSADVEDTLQRLQALGLVARVEGGRVERWRHLAYERWQVTKEQIAVLAELLLRGPQTEGELRARASRMEPFPDRESLRATVQPLVERGAIVWLQPEGRRGSQMTDGFHDPAELAQLRARAPSAPSESETPPPGTDFAAKLQQLHSEVDELRRQVAELRARVFGS